MAISTNNSRKAKFEDALSLTGYGKLNIFILLASGGSLMCVIIETIAMMFIVPSSQCDLELTLASKGVLNAISFIGVVSLSHFWGFVADTKGRRKILILSMFGSFITSAISSLVPNALSLIIVRYLNGVFVGGSSAVSYAYLGEFHDQKLRPKIISLVATFVAFGNIVIPSFAWLILPLDFKYYIPLLDIYYKPWRLLLMLYGFPALLVAIAVIFLPESPKFLLANGKPKEALCVLQTMFHHNTGKDKSEYPVSELEWDEVHVNINYADKKLGILESLWQQTIPLFKAPFGLKTLMVAALHFGIFAPSSGLIMWYPDILNKMSLYTKTYFGVQPTLCQAFNAFKGTSNNYTIATCNDVVESDVFIASLGLGCLFTVLYLTIGSLITKLGAKNLLIGCLVITTVCGFFAQFMTGLVMTLLMSLFLTASTCIGIVNTIIIDLYPTQLRAMALSISLMAGRVGAMTGSNLGGPILNTMCDYTFFILGSVHIIVIIIVFLLPNPRKKNTIKPIT